MTTHAFMAMSTAFLVISNMGCISAVTALPYSMGDPILSLSLSLSPNTNTAFTSMFTAIQSLPSSALQRKSTNILDDANGEVIRQPKTFKTTPHTSATPAAALLPHKRDTQGQNQGISSLSNINFVTIVAQGQTQGQTPTQPQPQIQTRTQTQTSSQAHEPHSPLQQNQDQDQNQDDNQDEDQDAWPQETLTEAGADPIANASWPAWMNPAAWTLVCYDAGLFILLIWVWVCGCVGVARYGRASARSSRSHVSRGRRSGNGSARGAGNYDRGRGGGGRGRREPRGIEMVGTGDRRVRRSEGEGGGRGTMLEGEMRRLGML